MRTPELYAGLRGTNLRVLAWDYASMNIERSAQEAHETGISLMRPMPFAFPGDPRLVNCDDQYLFGPDLLIAPMLGSGMYRTVLLPPGEWTDFWTATTYRGPRSIRVAMSLDRIGIFLRAGLRAFHWNWPCRWFPARACPRDM